jgi:murein DD-endopeptidase MepM/ murein hydrolase activator NlpD
MKKRFLLGFVVLVWAVACQADVQPTPTPVPLAELPVVGEADGGETAVSGTRGTPVSRDDGHNRPQPVVGSTPTAVYLPGNNGVRPEDAQQFWVRDLGPSQPPEQRPPTFEVPLSIAPDDHYWLIRPIPSGYRNYDLEWYPFGNDVQIPDLRPYRIHHGIDFPNETGTPILAASSGTVIHAGPLPSPRNGVNYYGNTVVIKHDWQWQGQDVYTLYAHTLELFVQEGDYVEQGQLIAGVGSSGEVSGPHLHLEVRIGENAYAFARNPALWLVPYEGWGTLAGRFVDRRGQMIPYARVVVNPIDVADGAGVETAVRVQQTYSPVVMSDEVWRENFVVPDLPAGRYELLVTFEDRTYRREVTIYPGQTSFEIISTEFEYVPTPTPIPSPTPTPTPTPEPPPEEGG